MLVPGNSITPEAKFKPSLSSGLVGRVDIDTKVSKWGKDPVSEKCLIGVQFELQPDPELGILSCAPELRHQGIGGSATIRKPAGLRLGCGA